MASKGIILGGPIKSIVIRDLVKSLTTLGYYAMANAYSLRSFQNRTRNLHDSYISAVFVDGELIERSIKRYGGEYSRKVDHNTKMTGRQTAEKALRNLKLSNSKNEIIVVVLAAMYYAGILESGYFGTKYTVIAPAKDYIERGWWAAVYKVYDKHGLKDMPNSRVISGHLLR